MTLRSSLIGAGRTLAFATFAAFAAAGATDAFAQARLELPQPNTVQSGIGVISGWSCTPGVQVVIDGTAYTAGHGTSRADAASHCGGNANVGFALAINYNTLGAGAHTAQLRVNGTNVGNPVPFSVTVPAGEFAVGLSGTVTLNGFPSANRSVTLQWQESQQNFAIVAVTSAGTGTGGFPILFKGIRLDGITTASSEEGRVCEATLSFTNTTSETRVGVFYFDVIQNGAKKDQALFPAFNLEPGASGTFTTTIVAGEELAPCGSFSLQFNATDSIVF